MRNQQNNRRGVILLIVLGMLAMFGLICITFVLLSGHARRGAQAQAKVGRADNPPGRIADDVINQILRGSTDRASVIGPHSLLEDLYGNGWVEDTIGATGLITGMTGDQLRYFTASGTGAVTAPYQRYVGCVLTMTSGPCDGLSTRIVGYDATQGFHILRFDTTVQPAINDEFVINGTPFSGTGFGYNPAAGGAGNETDPLLTANDPTGNPYALLPNPRAFTPNGAAYPDPAGPGGANEDYDAADYQNMLLASVVPQPGMNPNVVIPIPSLHRPSLVNYWFNQWVSTITWPPTPLGMTDEEFRLGIFLQPYGADCERDLASDPAPDDPDRIYVGFILQGDMDDLIALKRRIIMRPLREDHPNFTGSNPAETNSDPNVNVLGFAIDTATGDALPTYNWDVDNDGDAIMDSIWVDVGLPVRTMRDGRQYKPLAAILCVDMDGRLNLNAHGCLAQVEASAGSISIVDSSDNPRNIVAGGTDTLTSTNTPFGQGVGPAEVNLAALPGVASAYNALLTGIPGNMPGRYGGTDAVPGDDLPAVPQTGYDLPPADPLAANKFYNYPGLYNVSITYDDTSNSGTMSYGTPVDLTGGCCVGLDLRGQPLYAAKDNNNFGRLIGFHMDIGLRADNPYELKLSDTGRGVARTYAADTPFTLHELESLLRPYDVDASMLPGRIANLAPDLAGHRHELTTESWSLPCPAIVMPPELRTPAVAAWFPSFNTNHLADLLRAKLVEEDSNKPLPLRIFTDPTDQTQIDAMQIMVDNLLAPELLSGLKLNLNRPLGNGRDDNGNGVIDEPGEGAGTEQFYQVLANGTDNPDVNLLYLVPTDIDYDGDGDVDPDDLVFANAHSMARQLHARHLYVMMLLLMNHNGNPDVAREVAQWAVNIVDFRDRDSIMTGFEYDVNPFVDGNMPLDGNPWDVDGDLSTDDGITDPHVVWGCERPELLITETLAFHDRRTEDFSVYGNVGPGLTDDKDFDQLYLPQGSLFVELYNPWSQTESLPAEFYENVHNGVKLDKPSPQGSPVWRLIIVPGSDSEKDPDALEAADQPQIDREVYFARAGQVIDGITVVIPTAIGTQHFPNDDVAGEIAPVLPGRYAVIGPGPSTGSASTTYVARRAGNIGLNRHILLEAKPGPSDTDQVSSSADGTTPDLPTAIQNPIAIPIGEPRLSISEPIGGYNLTNIDTSDPLGDKYPLTEIKDLPEDSRTQLDLWRTHLSKNATHLKYAVIHLQRLANPLDQHDDTLNPYRTIDSISVDLTTFTGMTTATNDYGDGEGGTVAGAPVNFFSRERGDRNDTAGENNLWKQEPWLDVSNNPHPPVGTATQQVNHGFHENPDHTLGYLNEGFGEPLSVPTNTDYDGSPPHPFPWLTWFNRPFLSEMELLCVPHTRSSKLLKEFVMTAAEPYSGDTGISFKHLINFFRDELSPNTPPTNWKRHRLLEFVRVPSPFVGTELQGAPGTFSAGTHDFHPPFNRISKRRDPGRVNLNTITSQNVWGGLRGDFPNPAWRDFIESRRSYADPAPTGNPVTDLARAPFVMDDNLPTRFANPFRSFAGLYNIPDITALQNAVGGNPPTRREVNATLLRPAPVAGGGGFMNDPLFQHASASAVNNTDRNPYFRYQLLNRLGSTATTRSNVYAVWVTVGYFEVEPVGTDQPEIYPDGFRLGQEMGSDTGDITRHRAFYMIDRSIPVGFRRGEDLNTENAILLRRFIE